MKKIGLLKALSLCSSYPKMSPAKRQEVQQQRLREMVLHAKSCSPYYAKLYENLPKNFALSDIPTTDKLTLMKHFDEWITDSDVTLADANKFMENLDNIGRKFKKKYMVFTTSGSTGNPLVALCDSTTSNMMTAINVLRTYARKEDLKSFMSKGGKTVGVFATGGFYLGNSSVRSRLLAMPWKKKQMMVTSSLLPTDQIVQQLNAFQPQMLGGYPSTLELLIDEVQKGNLHISPVIVMTGGEYLSDALRARLSDAFHCYVQTAYACTEGGTMACECRNQHFHINDDWVIVEPIDQNNNPVPDGVLSDKILLTNLFNFTQPFIRYEVTDRIIMHHEACPCGNPSPWISIEGRTDDVTEFVQDGQVIKMAPLAIYPVLKEVHEIRRFQVLVYPENKILLRLIPADNQDKQAVFQKAEPILRSFLSTHGIHDVTITLDNEEPKQHEKSGKFKHIMNCCK